MGYVEAHKRVKRVKGSANNYPCSLCKKIGWINDWAYDHNDPDEKISATPSLVGLTYSDKIEHYIALCRSCHQQFDAEHRASVSGVVTATAE